MFITNNGSLLPCEKVGEKHTLCNCYENNMNFDYNAIAEKYTKYRELTMNQCKSCYKIECTECVYRIDFNEKGGCKEYISMSALKEILKNNILEFEKN